MASITARNLMANMTIKLTMPRSFAIRTRIACWLIGLAGRVLTVPVEFELVRKGDAEA